MHDHSNPSALVRNSLSHVRSLGNRHNRESQHKFWIEGIRNFVQAFDAKLEFDTVIYSEILLKSSLAEMLSRRLSAGGIRRVRVTPEQFRTVSTTPHASGIGAIVKQHWTALRNAEPRHGLGWLIVEQIRSPGNLGTILRTAEASGVGGIIFLGPRCDPFDPAVVRASMGGIFHLQLVRTTHEQLRIWAEQNAIHIFGLSPDAEPLWTALPQIRPVAIMIGDERHGLSDFSRGLCRSMIRLPMTGRADSLNVAVAAGIVMYELVRRYPYLDYHDRSIDAESSRQP
jgi:RNA methyltransferase, TrmH family